MAWGWTSMVREQQSCSLHRRWRALARSLSENRKLAWLIFSSSRLDRTCKSGVVGFLTAHGATSLTLLV